MKENFRQSRTYPDYLVGDQGTIISSARIDRRGHKLSERVLSPNLRKDGYCSVRLTNDSGQRSVLIHVLVAEVWIANPNNLTEIDHINGVRSYNAAHNLQWITRSANVAKGAGYGKVPIRGITPKLGKFMVRKSLDGKISYIGTFSSIEEAARAYKEAG